MKIKKIIFWWIAIICLAYTLKAFPQDKGTATVTWDANTESDLDGYIVFVFDSAKVQLGLPDSTTAKYQYYKWSEILTAAERPGAVMVSRFVDTNESRSAVFPELWPIENTFVFGAVAFDKAGNHSGATTLKKTFKDIVPPGNVSGFKVTVTVVIQLSNGQLITTKF